MINASLLEAILPEGDPDDSREGILDAALGVLSEYGFRKSSMEDVARAAGVSRVTLYRRFADKDALVHAVMLREARRSLLRILETLNGLPTAEERFVRGFVATVLVARQHPLFRHLLRSDAEIVLPRYALMTVSQTIDFGREFMAQIISGLQAQGEFKELDAAYLAEVLIRLWHSLVLVPSAKVDSDDEKSLTRLARGFLHPLLSRQRGR